MRTEYPQAFSRHQLNERYYPINNKRNQHLYDQYLALSRQNPRVVFFGRLGDYRYYDMDQAVHRALNLTIQT